jgi:hypothetical protein
MAAASFATKAKTGPDPWKTTHAHGGGDTPYTCHMAVMHWMFMVIPTTSRTNV